MHEEPSLMITGQNRYKWWRDSFVGTLLEAAFVAMGLSMGIAGIALFIWLCAALAKVEG